MMHILVLHGFNTASGKYYCNQVCKFDKEGGKVSIPQAVSTIAMQVYLH